MKIGKRFNQLSKKEYFYYIENRKKYTDFNTLGLYRSICENEKLTLEDKIEVRDFANQTFAKTFNFYQLKDPLTYYKLITLGQELTKADERQIWKEIQRNQQKTLTDKKIRHRNFGEYSKHNCGYDDCPLNGLMITRNSPFAEWHMSFETDHSNNDRRNKSERFRKERKQKTKIIRDQLDDQFRI